MKLKLKPRADGPIPGANFTSDTRNYPWHRPPQITKYDEAVADAFDSLNTEQEAELLYSMLDLEVPVYMITSTFLLRQIAKGKISIDLAILISGPVARMIDMTAKNNGQKADMSTEDPKRVTITPRLLQMQLGGAESLLESRKDSQVGKAPEEEDEGFMALSAAPETASPEEQAAMLGVTDDEERV